MGRKDFWILLVIGVLLIVNVIAFPLYPSFSLVAAYILVRIYDYESRRGLASRVALFLFLVVFIIFLFMIYIFILTPSLMLFLIILSLISMSVFAYFLCFYVILEEFILLRIKRHRLIMMALLFFLLFVVHSVYFITDGKGIETLIIMGIALALFFCTLTYQGLTLIEKKEGKMVFFEKVFKKTEKKKFSKEPKEYFGLVGMYIIGGVMLMVIVYTVFSTTIIRNLLTELYALVALSAWAATFLALSSKHKISDLGFIIFGAIFLPFFFFPSFYDLHLFTTESMLVIIRVLLGISFTLILLGYDIRRIPREGLIEYSIYGLSFIPLVSSLIFVTPYINHTHIALIFVLLVLIKIILTAGYVYKRIGVV